MTNCGPLTSSPHVLSMAGLFSFLGKVIERIAGPEAGLQCFVVGVWTDWNNVTERTGDLQFDKKPRDW